MTDRTQDLSLPKPFSLYMLDVELLPEVERGANIAYSAIALAKRILIQEKCRDFTAADIVALASIIAAERK